MRIIVGIDGGTQQEAALALGARLARGGELIVATVYPMSRATAGLGDAYAAGVKEAAEEILATAGRTLPQVEVDARAIAEVSAPRALHRLAEDEHADLLVIGACHRGRVGRAVLGSTGERVVHGAPCPVVVAPRDMPTEDRPIATIGVAYDGRAESEHALEWAREFAERSGATLRLITAVQPVPIAAYSSYAYVLDPKLASETRAAAETQQHEALERVRATVSAEGVVLDGPAERTIADATADLDMLVAGSRDYGPVGALLLGSVARGLIHDAQCPVVVLPRSATTPDRETEPADALTAG